MKKSLIITISPQHLKTFTKYLKKLWKRDINDLSSEVQPVPRPPHVMNSRVLKRPLEDRVKQQMLIKIKVLSLKKFNIFSFDNIENHTKELWLVNGYIIYFRRKLKDSKLQIICSLGMGFQHFLTVLSTLKREETFRK